jgi:hypothetical protein
LTPLSTQQDAAAVYRTLLNSSEGGESVASLGPGSTASLVCVSEVEWPARDTQPCHCSQTLGLAIALAPKPAGLNMSARCPTRTPCSAVARWCYHSRSVAARRARLGDGAVQALFACFPPDSSNAHSNNKLRLPLIYKLLRWSCVVLMHAQRANTECSARGTTNAKSTFHWRPQ